MPTNLLYFRMLLFQSDFILFLNQEWVEICKKLGGGGWVDLFNNDDQRPKLRYATVHSNSSNFKMSRLFFQNRSHVQALTKRQEKGDLVAHVEFGYSGVQMWRDEGGSSCRYSLSSIDPFHVISNFSKLWNVPSVFSLNPFKQRHNSWTHNLHVSCLSTVFYCSVLSGEYYVKKHLLWLMETKRIV